MVSINAETLPVRLIKRFERESVEFTKETVAKRGKTVLEKFVKKEEIPDFFIRVEKILNNLANEGWYIVSTNYGLPIQGLMKVNPPHGMAGYSETDWNEIEFVVVLQRAK